MHTKRYEWQRGQLWESWPPACGWTQSRKCHGATWGSCQESFVLEWLICLQRAGCFGLGERLKARKIKGGFLFWFGFFFFFFGVNKKERYVFCLVQTDHRHLIAKYSYPKGENSGQFSGAYFEKTLSWTEHTEFHSLVGAKVIYISNLSGIQ